MFVIKFRSNIAGEIFLKFFAYKFLVLFRKTAKRNVYFKV